MDDILVSIIMITYRQEKFIEQAIEGVLMQRTNFQWELLIGDDCSPDATQVACSKYLKNDARIQYFRNDSNIGANRNFLNMYKKCRGKYIALCEGDDYWIDPYKLQKQVDFLSANKDFTICFHDVYELNLGILKSGSVKYEKTEFNILDLARGNFIYTPSVLFVNFGDKLIPSYFSSIYVGDYILHMQVSKFGKIKMLDEKMSVYRIHEGSNWSTKKDEFICLKTIEYLRKLLKDNFDPKVKTILKRRLSGVYHHLFQMTNKHVYLLQIAKLSPLTAMKGLFKRVFYFAR